MSNINPWIKHVKKWEGGTAPLDPVDKGGLTRYGVTYDTYASLAKGLFNQTASLSNFEQFTAQDAEKVMAWFWKYCGADKINNQAIAEFIADQTWGGGISYGPKLAQRVLNTVFGKNLAIDGKIGNQSLNAINSVPAIQYYNALQNQRKADINSFVNANPEQIKFKQGWNNRLADLALRAKPFLNNSAIVAAIATVAIIYLLA